MIRKNGHSKVKIDGNDKGNGHEDDIVERIESEERDQESSPVSFEINVYPLDYPLETLWEKIKQKEIKVPEFQRKFVWTQKQSSRLIESFLLGLPVPPIFLYVDKADNKLLVIDGQQRVKTVRFFFEGTFGEEEVGGQKPVFRLTGLDDKSPFANKNYNDLLETNEAFARKLKNTVLRAYVIKQLDPHDDTSIYHIFERLNTGGTFLKGQEIRNCIYHGPFNDLLHTLNETTPEWREIFGKQTEDKRQRDIELILRFLALYYDANEYEKPMKDFLSDFMSKHRYAKTETLEEFRSLFVRTAKNVHQALHSRPFELSRGLNAAVFDSVFTAFARHDKIPSGIKAKYVRLTKDGNFKSLVSQGTTDEAVVAKRLKLAREKLFGNSRR
jgi:hypothetical protein